MSTVSTTVSPNPTTIRFGQHDFETENESEPTRVGLPSQRASERVREEESNPVTHKTTNPLA